MSRNDTFIDAACDRTRPDATIRTHRRRKFVVWRVERDPLVDSDAKVPTSSRWRAQVVSRILRDGSVYWSGVEHHSSTRSGAVRLAETEIDFDE